MTAIDCLIHARYVAPVEPPVLLADHALAIRSGRIEAVLPSELAQARYSARDSVILARHLLIPGLVDAHARPAERLLRHVPEAPRSARPALIRAGIALALAERTAAGITTTLDASESPAAAAAAATAQGVRVVLALPMDPIERSIDEQFERSLATHDEFRDHPLLRTAFRLREPLAADAATLRRLRVLADQLERPVMLPVQASREEMELCREWYGLTPVDWLSSLGLWNANTVALDFSVAGTAAIAAAAEAGVTIIHRIWRDLGHSPLAAGSGLTPVAALGAAGVPVALGSDDGDSDLLVLARTARRVAGPDGTAPDWLRRLTLDGARALGLEATTGSLAPGKWADLCAIDLGGLATAPASDPIAALIESAARDCVTDVWVAGRRLIASRERLNVDPDGLAEDATAAVRNSLAASGSAGRESRS
jgi:5-methylthioadenosine/S-adenosylhomocysteine deaminase